MARAVRAAVAEDMRWRRLQGLPRITEIDDRLREGQSPEYVARVIHEDMRELLDVKRPILTSLLAFYRTEALGVQGAVSDPTRDSFVDKLMRRITKKVEVYDHYVFLIEAQRFRLERLLNLEDDANETHKLKDEFDVFGRTLKDFAQFQMDTGMLRKMPSEVNVDVSTGSARALLEADRSKKASVNRAMVRVLEAVQRLDQEQGEDDTNE